MKRQPSLSVQSEDAILIVRLGAVGDVVRTLPCLARLREACPRSRLGWLVESGAAPLLPGKPWLDQILIFPREIFRLPRVLRYPRETRMRWRHFMVELRRFRARLLLDFQGSAKSALLGRLSGAPWRLGFAASGAREGSYLLNNVRVSPSDRRLNRVYKNFELLSGLGITPGPLNFPFSPIHPSPRVADFLRPVNGKIRIVLHPGTSLRQAYKRWPSSRFAELAGRLSAEGCAPILTWGPGEYELAEEVRRLSSNVALMAPPTNLGELRELLGGCHLFVGGDTGPMHLAWSHGIPVVALFGGSDPAVNGPLGKECQILAPAWEAGSPFPRRGNREAIREVSLESVHAAVRTLLRSRSDLNGSGLPR